MALISCPECGKEISSTSGQCVTCGYKFTYCEMCNSVEAADATFCSKCGASLNADVQASNVHNAEETPAQPIYEKAAHFDLWNENDQANKIVKKTGFFLPLALSLLSLLFAVLFVVKLTQNVSDFVNSPISSNATFAGAWMMVWPANEFDTWITVAIICACITAAILPLYRTFVLFKFGAYYKGLNLSQKDGLANHISYLALDAKANKPKIFAKHTTLDLNFKANCIASSVSGKTLIIYPIITFITHIGCAIASQILMFTALKNVLSTIHVVEQFASNPADLLNVYNNELIMFVAGLAIAIVSSIVVSVVNNMWVKANSAAMHKIANESNLDITNTPYGKYAQVK